MARPLEHRAEKWTRFSAPAMRQASGASRRKVDPVFGSSDASSKAWSGERDPEIAFAL
jgi:hypothetical protein